MIRVIGFPASSSAAASACAWRSQHRVFDAGILAGFGVVQVEQTLPVAQQVHEGSLRLTRRQLPVWAARRMS